MGKERARIVFADDHRSMHGLLNRILGAEFEIVAAVSDGLALIEAAREHQPDVLVVDISMPELDGIQAVKRLQEEGENFPVVFLTTHTEAALVEQALKTGALGFVLKVHAADELALAIRETPAHRSFVSPAVRTPE